MVPAVGPDRTFPLVTDPDFRHVAQAGRPTPAPSAPGAPPRSPRHPVGLLPVLAATLTTLGLQHLFHNPLLSIFTGTGLYVLLRNSSVLLG